MTEAEEDLATYLEERPESDHGWALAIERGLDVANDLLENGQLTRADEAWERVGETLAQAVEHAPDGPHVLIARIFHADAVYRRDPRDADRDLVRQLATQLVEHINQTDDRWLLRRTTALLLG